MRLLDESKIQTEKAKQTFRETMERIERSKQRIAETDKLIAMLCSAFGPIPAKANEQREGPDKPQE